VRTPYRALYAAATEPTRPASSSTRRRRRWRIDVIEPHRQPSTATKAVEFEVRVPPGGDAKPRQAKATSDSRTPVVQIRNIMGAVNLVCFGSLFAVWNMLSVLVFGEAISAVKGSG
jgi:hypothetical protein